jgi:ABC-2 type transport system permease protein
MNLLRAELRRLFKRRITKLMFAFVLALLATVAISIAATHQKPGPAARAEAEARAAQEFQAQQRFIEADIAACEADNAAGNDRGWPENCEDIRGFMPSQEEMVEWYMPPTFDFRESFPEMIVVFTALMAMFGFIVGASYVGAEWRTGGMTNLLLWQPRRLLVFAAKLLSLLAGQLGLVLLLGAAWTGTFWLVATYRGITDTMTAGAWQSMGLTWVRGLVLALVAGAVGFGLASLGRHTALAMGTAIGAFVIGVGGVELVGGAMLQVRFYERFMWTSYVEAWMAKTRVLVDWFSPCATPNCEPPTMELTWQHAGIGMAALMAMTLAAAMWHMRSRDVT